MVVGVGSIVEAHEGSVHGMASSIDGSLVATCCTSQIIVWRHYEKRLCQEILFDIQKSWGFLMKSVMIIYFLRMTEELVCIAYLFSLKI